MNSDSDIGTSDDEAMAEWTASSSESEFSSDTSATTSDSDAENSAYEFTSDTDDDASDIENVDDKPLESDAQAYSGTPLHNAVWNGDINQASRLLMQKANKHARDSAGRTPMQCICHIEKHLDRFPELNPFKVNKIKRLLGHKQRLALGEADFAFTGSLTIKHPQVAKRLTATEYVGDETLQRNYPDSYSANTSALNQKGANVYTGVDATRLSQPGQFGGDTFERIHFNFPHDKSNFKDRTLPKMLAKFFLEAAKLQLCGHRIYMALPNPEDKDYKNFYFAYVYCLYAAATNAGYKLVKKRQFGSNRYPGYEHKITGRNSSASVADNTREYIFEKTDMTAEEIERATPPKYKYCYGGNYRLWRSEPETSNGSSDYSNSDISSDSDNDSDNNSLSHT